MHSLRLPLLPRPVAAALLLAGLSLASLPAVYAETPAPAPVPTVPPAQPAAATATPSPVAAAPLFDGKTLQNWKVTDFAGHGEVKIDNGQVLLEAGNDITGINYTGKGLPKQSYEISLEAMRLQGDDFFCALTFPVGDTHVTYVVGGWGGSVVGISSINGEDASENETTQFLKFETNKWYKVRVRVTPKKLEAFIDDKRTAEVDLGEEKRLSLRAGEIDQSLPLGIASYRTKAAIKEIKLTKLP